MWRSSACIADHLAELLQTLLRPGSLSGYRDRARPVVSVKLPGTEVGDLRAGSHALKAVIVVARVP